MQRPCVVEKSTTEAQFGSLLAAGAHYPRALCQGNGDEIQTDGSKLSARAPSLKRPRSGAFFGLPCASCKAYYASDLPACPICKSAERVPHKAAEAKSANISQKPLAGVLNGARGSFINLDSTLGCKQPMQLVLRCDEEDERVRFESRLLLCAHTEEIDAGHTSPCILGENHNLRSEHASICVSCYNRLHEKLALMEAALLIDLGEATQIVYEAVWANPPTAAPKRTYQSAAQALLNKLCQRAGIAASMCGVTPSESVGDSTSSMP
jgi:hypothetical protein